jgi:hypothetical protein
MAQESSCHSSAWVTVAICNLPFISVMLTKCARIIDLGPKKSHILPS